MNRASAIQASLAVAALVASLAFTPANAATRTTTFRASTTVAATCNINSAGIPDFGSRPGTQNSNTSSITVACTKATPYNLALDAGARTTETARDMTGPEATPLNDSLFRNSAQALNRRNAVGTDAVQVAGNGVAQASTVSGPIPAGQPPVPGSDTDTITVTVTF